MATPTLVSGAEAGLSGDEQIRIALNECIQRGGRAPTSAMYEALERRLAPKNMALSERGKSSLRFFINHRAVQAGYVLPHDPNTPGWQITPEGRAFAAGETEDAPERIIDTDTGSEVAAHTSQAIGDAFENYALKLLRLIYPHYAWYHQGRYKKHERGLDFVGTRLGDAKGEASSIGVQVKCHQPTHAPTETEWLKFLAGCFARRVDAGVFITTGRLTSEQRREAQEAKVIVIEGREELDRHSAQNGLEAFELGREEDAED